MDKEEKMKIRQVINEIENTYGDVYNIDPKPMTNKLRKLIGDKEEVMSLGEAIARGWD